jgi:hypothetical protein
MELPELIVGCITLTALIAHVLIGTRETAALKPDDSHLTTHWVQAMSAFQMLSVDLLVVCALLFAIAIFDLGPIEPALVLLLAALFLLWGLVWILQTLWLQREFRALLRLPHWLVWFFCSGLLFWAA